MISMPHRTIFVHIPKCAGQSVEATFCSDLGLDWARHRHLLGCMQRPRSWSRKMPERLAHLTAHQYTALNFCPPRMFDAFFRFTIIRHPVDRAISMWRFLPTKLPFDDFVRAELLPGQERGEFFFQSQCDYIMHPETGRILVDEVIPFSKLVQRWEHISRRTGLKTPLAHRNRGSANKPVPELQPETRILIEQAYSDDFAHFQDF